MAKLILSLDGAFLGEYALDKNLVTIGRRSVNDIHIDNLAVSGEHASVSTLGDDSFLEDLKSSNGTLVNGKSIKKHVLQDGDVIEIGKYQLIYAGPPRTSATSEAAGAAASMAAGATTHGSQMPTAKTPAENAPDKAAMSASEATSGPVGRLQVLNGSSQGKELALNKVLTTLGKPGVQVAVITRRAQGYFISHVEGESHPMVNEKSVGTLAYQLGEHDVIEIAGIKMVFFHANP